MLLLKDFNFNQTENKIKMFIFHVERKETFFFPCTLSIPEFIHICEYGWDIACSW